MNFDIFTKIGLSGESFLGKNVFYDIHINIQMNKGQNKEQLSV